MIHAMKPKLVVVHDSMQRDYCYELSAPVGACFAADFRPELTPKQMLELGVFGGRYMRDCTNEFPDDWFRAAKFATGRPDPKLNYFGVAASQPLKEWQRKGWIYPEDPRGWFQWYCRYYMGRRIPLEDERQIGRWKAMRRHVGQIKANCLPHDLACRPKQRQALLHWAYDSREI